MAKWQTAMRFMSNGSLSCKGGKDYTVRAPQYLPITHCVNCDGELIPNRSYKSNTWLDHNGKPFYVCAACFEKEVRK